jgi:formamidopyrimidine-DNA glycosylase
MPELPEVETTRRGLLSVVLGRRITAMTIYDRRLRWPVPRDLPDGVLGARVVALDRRSKYLLLGLDRGTLIVHFGMTGSLTAWQRAPARRAHDHVDWRLDDGTTLRYHDPRRFGAVLWTTEPPGRHPLLRDLGPEPLEPGFDGERLWRAARGRDVAIKAFLMDSHVVVGVGNIYANEALYRAGIRPTLRARRVSRERMAHLATAVQEVLRDAIASGGSTLRDYVNGQGEPGSFQFTHYVYGRQGEPCRRCGVPIRARYLGQRNTFYCPRCQT